MQTLEEYAGGSLREVVTNFEWKPVDSEGHSYGVLIKIKVCKDADGGFCATPSHRVKATGATAPYMPSGPPRDTVEDAVRYCIQGLKLYMRSASETEWSEAEGI